MLDGIGAWPLVGAWLPGWELVMDSPDASSAAVGILFAMAMTGIGLAVFGGGRREEPVRTAAVVVQAPRPRRRARRR